MLTPECPPSGSTVRLEVLASALSGSGLMIETRGQVVRVESIVSLPDVAGFAAATRSLKLRDCKPAVTEQGAEYGLGQGSTRKSWTGSSRKHN